MTAPAWRPRWRLDATGFVARYRGQWASKNTWADRGELAAIVANMPNGNSIEIVEVTA